jgi:ribose 5-phosphate isomerase B
MTIKTNSVALGSDHRGVKLKNYIYNYLVPDTDEEPTKFNISVIEDVGAYDEKSVDYPDIVHEVANYLEFQSHGILICGSGHGVTMAANRYKHVRAANCRTVKDVEMARKHNNINCLCLGADYVKQKDVWKMVQTFFNTKFEGGRHLTRLKKI